MSLIQIRAAVMASVRTRPPAFLRLHRIYRLLGAMHLDDLISRRCLTRHHNSQAQALSQVRLSQVMPSTS